ncbi:trypsin-like peptidase domain-containing protein [Streptomyces sp. NPDC003393]
MNEGKPTKSTRPRWWTRSRSVAPAGPVDTAAAGEPGEPAGTVGAQPGPPTPRGSGSGDYELRRPHARPREDAAPDGDDGDFPLARPASTDPGGDPTGPGPADAADRATNAMATPPGDGVAARAVPSPAEPAGDGAAERAADGAGDRPVAAPGDAVHPAERPTPLHEPDPYSTPPYGEPGPWAPAPPVQHPAVTPAPGPTQTQGSAPAAPAPVPAPGTPAAAVPAPPHATPAPAPLPTDPSVSISRPPGAPAPACPSPADGDARAAAEPTGRTPAPDAASVHDGVHPAVPSPQVAADGPAAPGPWQRYDPWAAAPLGGPLQHSGAQAPNAERRRRRVRRVLVGGAVVLALVSGGLGGLVGAYVERNGGVGAVELPQAGKEPAGRAPDSVAGIAARALPSVVTLHVTGSEEQGTGTGFVLDRLGHILTNNHVVEPAATGGAAGDISVTFSGGQTAKATIVGRDTGYDLAVVQVRGVRGLTPMPLGNSDNVQVGDPVVAIGAPFDLANTVTSGIISAKERPITAGGEKGDGSDLSYVDALQTDAPINPGNSGGPLLDSRGRVIGINSAIRSADSGSDPQTGQAGSIGLGFAIPVNQAKRVAEELINTGRASHPVIGVTLDMSYAGDGAKVGAKGRDGGSAVTPGGPGAKAGIKAGDVITAVDGQDVHSGEELIVKTRAHRPGDRLELTIERGGTQRKGSLVLGSSNSD